MFLAGSFVQSQLILIVQDCPSRFRETFWLFYYRPQKVCFYRRLSNNRPHGYLVTARLLGSVSMGHPIGMLSCNNQVANQFIYLSGMSFTYQHGSVKHRNIIFKNGKKKVGGDVFLLQRSLISLFWTSKDVCHWPKTILKCTFKNQGVKEFHMMALIGLV